MIYHDTTAIDAVNEGRDIPDGFYEPKHPTVLMATRKHIATDGWRGYNTVIAEPGFKKLDDASDWTTGDWGDAISDEQGPDATERKLKALEAEHGDVFVIFTPTSNVFSTGFDVLIRDHDYKPTRAERGKLIARATRRFEEPDGSFRVRYHATVVTAYDAKRDVYTLNTGGWNTMTTGKRMTDALPAGWYVYRRNWIMYLHRPGADDVEIKDGMEVQA
jgi:hypothetical protein